MRKETGRLTAQHEHWLAAADMGPLDDDLRHSVVEQFLGLLLGGPLILPFRSAGNARAVSPFDDVVLHERVSGLDGLILSGRRGGAFWRQPTRMRSSMASNRKGRVVEPGPR